MSRPPRDVGSFRGLEGLSDEVVQRLEQLRELVQRGAGTRGTADALPGGSGGTTTNITITGPGGGGSSTPDLTPPPTPTGVAVNAGLTYVFIEHDAPTFTQGHGYARTKVYGATYEGTGPLPTFDPGSGTPLIHEFVGQVGAFPTNPATEWHLWVTWVSVDGVESTAPSGGTNGHVATTGQDVSVLLELLTGQITESQLYQALGAKINAIDPAQLDTLAHAVMQAVVALHSESRDRIDAIQMEAATRVEALLAEALARGAAITEVRTEFQSADESLAQDITTLTAAVVDGDEANAAALQLEILARASAVDAEAEQRELLAAQVQTNDETMRALVSGVSRASADADSATAENQILMMATSYNEGRRTQASITQESITRTEDNLALASRTELLEAKVDIPGGSSISSILTAYATLSTLTAATASVSSEITAAFTAADAGVLSTAQAYVQGYSYSKAEADSSLAAQGSTLTANFTAADADTLTSAQGWVQSYAYSKAQADTAIATAVEEVSVRLDSGGDISTAIVNAQTTASAKNATFKQSTAPTATRVGDTWIDTANGNLLKAWDGSAWVASDDQRIGTTASSVTTLQSQIAGTAGSELLSQIQEEATTRADQTGDLFAQWTVKTSVAGLISGFGLASTANNAAPSSMFGIQTNTFYVAPPHQASSTAPTTNLFDGYVWLDTSVIPNVTRYRSGASWVTTPPVLPFIIQTTPTTINGVSVPAGVYMDTAFIRNGTITNALIGNAAIDNAKIANLSAAKIIAGSIAVGEYIQSSTYVANTSGWRIHGNGTAELQNAIVRGTVWATAGEFASTVRLGAASSFAAGNGIWQGLESSTPKWRVGLENSKRIQWDGNELAIYGSANNKVLAVSGSTLEVNTTNFGIDAAGNARFSGDISGATGVFAGSLAAGVVDMSKITGQNFTVDTPGTHAIVTMPYTGTVRFTIVGAGGGGGGGGSVGGSGIAGLPGQPGTVTTHEITGVPAGATVSVTIGAGGAGAASNTSVTSPPVGSGGGTTSITVSSVGTWNASGGASGGWSTSPAGGIAYTYRMMDYGDFGGVLVAPSGAAPSGVPGAYAGARGLNGVDPNVLHLGLSGQASKLNGGNGYRGGGGGGGAPTRAWVGSRELYADPVDGENGDGSPTSAGGYGGNGYAFIEIFNPNSVVLRNDFEDHKAELRAADLVGPGSYTTVFSGSSASLNLYTLYGRDIYSVKWANGQTAMVAIDVSNQTVVAQRYADWSDGAGGPLFFFAAYNVVAVYRIRWQLNGAAIS